jgi:hypothetical protein
LAAASELVVAWGVGSHNVAWAATSPNLLVATQAAVNVNATQGYQFVASTSAITPQFTAASNPATDIVGVTSFKAAGPGALLTAVANFKQGNIFHVRP